MPNGASRPTYGVRRLQLRDGISVIRRVLDDLGRLRLEHHEGEHGAGAGQRGQDVNASEPVRQAAPSAVDPARVDV